MPNKILLKNTKEASLYGAYRPDIDGLRAIAVLSVVIFHAFPGFLKGGFVGVDVFFLISGYLITSIVIKDIDHKSFNFHFFYLRRIRRIFPALLIVLYATYTFGYLVLFPDEFKDLAENIIAGSLFLSNIYLWKDSGYFDLAAEIKPLLHLWSLSIEEQFYIVWPAFLYYISGKRSKIQIILTIVFIGGSFYLNISKIYTDQSFVFYFPFTRLWELGVGGLLALLNADNNIHKIQIYTGKIQKFFLQSHLGISQNTRYIFRDFASTLAFGVLISSFFLMDRSGYPGYQSLVPVLATLFLLGLGKDAIINQRLLSNPLMIWFGLISYPLYLWHWPMLVFLRITNPGFIAPYQKLIIVFGAICFSWLTYKFIETPIRSSRNLKHSGYVLLIFMLILMVISLYTLQKNGLAYRMSGEEFSPSAAFQQLGKIKPENSFNSACESRFSYPKLPNKTTHKFCALSADAPPSIILIGNSFANHLYPGFKSNPALQNQTILSVGICNFAPIYSAETVNMIDGCEVNYKKNEQEWIANIVVNSPSIKFAVIDGLDRIPSDEYIERVRSRINFLEKNNIKVIIFVPHYIPYFSIAGCLSRPLSSTEKNCNFDKTEIDELVNKFNPLISQIKNTNPNVLFFDQNLLFCKNNKCSYLHDGMPLSRDMYFQGNGGHYSIYGSERLAKIFVEWANINLPDIVH